MRVIKAADSGIAKVWNEGRIQPSAYRLPAYTISTEVDGGALFLNTVTGELIFLTADEAQMLSSLPCDYTPWMDELIKKHFLVRSELDDKKTVDSLRLAMRTLNASKEITSYIILPTTNCNARCFYCYEAGCRHENMSDETADRLVDFMDAHRDGKPLYINWFGGEPLVGMRQIDRISKALTERSIPFSSSMASNAYLFNEEIAGRAKKDWKLTSIQITLDGTEAIYNKTKAFITPCGSPYQKVLENIGFLLQNDIKVNIRLNLGLHNADDLTVLVDELAELFKGKTKLNVYSHFLYDNCGVEPIHYDDSQKSLLFEKKKALDERINQRGNNAFKMPLPKLCTNHCMADNNRSLMVLPSGKLGKCEHFLDSHFVGNIENGITDVQELKAIRERIIFPQCDRCPLYPACIKMKLCEEKLPCFELEYRNWSNEIIRTMRQYYKDYHKGVHPQEPEETPNC